jgi:pyruvate/2-oxoglutarate dehydrogenase complex dihydrolipoamide acyltransferase (E2) component
MGMSEGTVTAWLKNVGDRVTEDEPIAEIEAEKATQELESPATGTLTEIVVAEGDEAKVRSIIAWIETDD